MQSKYHKELWYIGNNTNTVDVNERLLTIKPPCEFQRTPRNFESLKYWKLVVELPAICCNCICMYSVQCAPVYLLSASFTIGRGNLPITKG